MRFGLVVLALAATFLATSDAVFTDSTLPKVTSNEIQSVDTVPSDDTKRMLRSDRKTADEEERFAFNIRLRVLNWAKRATDEFAIEKLERMLTDQEYKQIKFWVWYRNKESTEAVTARFKGTHYEGLANEYYQFRHPKITIYNNVK